eukprot:TRINITY_DN4732_c0_g1_i2.p1 TRINITY_DN4732_c0_g1~~TRINITY_DN4732_c0_g1_i2.p1  ORF type:complete len:230 (-),score=76.60 TRINITY_DN4732_c0_g1_i2:111-800(-)
MSMWGKFSNLTDQLSSAIAEDDGDGDDGLDPVSLELRRTRTQLERVSAILATTKSELERYKKESSDLAERLSASEVQTMHIGREYRNLLVEKEKELAARTGPAMSMWGKFSNLTDQLSSAIAEDDGDGDDGLDPVSLELRRTRTQLERVSAILATTKSELERYKKESSDLAERLSASEVQTMHIGREYRNLLVEKEKELAAVKAEHHHLKAEHTQLLMRNRLLVDAQLD